MDKYQVTIELALPHREGALLAPRITEEIQAAALLSFGNRLASLETVGQSSFAAVRQIAEYLRGQGGVLVLPTETLSGVRELVEATLVREASSRDFEQVFLTVARGSSSETLFRVMDWELGRGARGPARTTSRARVRRLTIPEGRTVLVIDATASEDPRLSRDLLRFLAERAELDRMRFIVLSNQAHPVDGWLAAHPSSSKVVTPQRLDWIALDVRIEPGSLNATLKLSGLAFALYVGIGQYADFRSGLRQISEDAAWVYQAAGAIVARGSKAPAAGRVSRLEIREDELFRALVSALEQFDEGAITEEEFSQRTIALLRHLHDHHDRDMTMALLKHRGQRRDDQPRDPWGRRISVSRFAIVSRREDEFTGEQS